VVHCAESDPPLIFYFRMISSETGIHFPDHALEHFELD
jgi:hypothetical protein